VRTVDRIVVRKNGRKYQTEGRVLKQNPDKDGYLYVQFSMNGKMVHRFVHRIVASCFLPNPDNLPQVNHKDCDRVNNNVKNLEWCDGYYNQRYREEHGEAFGRPVIAIDMKTTEVLRFRSQHEAARELGPSQGNIGNVIRGQRNQTHGHWFTNADNNAVEATRAKFGDEVANKVSELMSGKEL